MMLTRLKAFALALAAPLVLTECLLTPGKFVSTMTINADRSFTFAYKGEVIRIDPSSAMKGIGDKAPTTDEPEAKPSVYRIAAKKKAKPTDDADADAETKNREIAAALSKEAGYRSVKYVGKGKFLIDYVITGTLTHNFVFPFNSDAEAVFPFLIVELRQGGLVRVKAPGFADNSSSNTGMNGLGSDARKAIDGIFTLDTDAEIVSQNNEAGASAAGGRKTVSWKVTPLTKDAPTAVLRLTR